MTTGVALVGYGMAGRDFHAPLIATAGGLTLRRVVTSRAEQVAAEQPGATAAPDLATALRDEAVGLVVVATPNDTHADLARQALEAGRDVVVDKPFALDLAEARGLVDLARARGRKLHVFHNRRWDADFLTAKDLIESGALGRIARFESHYLRFRPQARDRWRERPGPGAGFWYDLAPHLIDQAIHLFGLPLGVTADIYSQRDPDAADDGFHAVLRYDHTRVILQSDVLTIGSERRFAIHGDMGGWIKSGKDTQEAAMAAGERPGGPGWGHDPRPGVLTHADGSTETTPGRPGDYTAFYRAIADGGEPVAPDSALAVMSVLDAGRESTRRRCEVTPVDPHA